MSDLENVYLHLKSISLKVPLKNCSYHRPFTQRLFLCFISMLDISMLFFNVMLSYIAVQKLPNENGSIS